MNREFYNNLTEQSLAGKAVSREVAEQILLSDRIELLPLLDAAYQIRRKFWNNDVTVHIINNAQNGHCPEDCHYCAQAKSSKADIEEYPMKSDEEILAEAKAAYDKGAYRYCMVFAGRGPSDRRVEKLSSLIKQIKALNPQGEVCLSAGLINTETAFKLKAAGLDRLNHNLNTSEKHYPNICTTHTFQDRLDTLKAGREAGIELCSGLIAGLGEKTEDIIDVAFRLRELKVESIPVNFLVPIEGNVITESDLTPQYCLRVLCLYRFLNPQCELRVAAGREGHLRSMEVMSLYPANSLFLQGYLNTKGSSNAKTLRMIKDAGFNIRSQENLEELLAQEEGADQEFKVDDAQVLIKDLKDLRPQMVK